jgi:hypothetical protein
LASISAELLTAQFPMRKRVRLATCAAPTVCVFRPTRRSST